MYSFIITFQVRTVLEYSDPRVLFLVNLKSWPPVHEDPKTNLESWPPVHEDPKTNLESWPPVHEDPKTRLMIQISNPNF